MVDLGVCF